MVLNQTVWEWHSLIPSCPWRFQMWRYMKNCQPYDFSQAHKKLQILQLHANLDKSEGPKGKFCSKANNFQAPVTSDMRFVIVIMMIKTTTVYYETVKSSTSKVLSSLFFEPCQTIANAESEGFLLMTNGIHLFMTF